MNWYESKYSWKWVPWKPPPKRSVLDRISDFFEVYSCFDEQTAREQASRCIQCANPTCVQACIMSNRIPEWLALTAEGHFLEAAAISQSTSNLPEICGRLCPQEYLCEGACILNSVGDPIPIGAIERFLNEYAFEHGGVVPATAPPNGFKVAVVGSGPGGLTAADELAKRGYDVTVFEAQLIPGGLLVNGIPAFKIEKTVIQRRIDILKKMGVKFRLGVRIGTDIMLDDLVQQFDAVYLAIGAQKARKLDVPGSDLNGIYQALTFLVQKNSYLKLDIPQIDVANKRVAVLGGGDTAMDCLRTAIRCGASETVCIYRRDFENMPGSRTEYKNAVEEGAKFLFLTNPVEVLGNSDGWARAVKCIKMQLGEPDKHGRRKPIPIPGSEFEIPVDVIIVAYGFDPVDLPKTGLMEKIARNEWGGIVVDENFMTTVPGVFAGGDIVRGPSLVAHASRDARKAAAAIHQYIMNKKSSETVNKQ